MNSVFLIPQFVVNALLTKNIMVCTRTWGEGPMLHSVHRLLSYNYRVPQAGGMTPVQVVPQIATTRRSAMIKTARK